MKADQMARLFAVPVANLGTALSLMQLKGFINLDNGKYYITAEFDTSLPTLSNDASSNAAPPGGVPFPTSNNMGQVGQAYDEYMKKITNLINSSSADKFDPSLNSLDTLVQTISVK